MTESRRQQRQQNEGKGKKGVQEQTTREKGKDKEHSPPNIMFVWIRRIIGLNVRTNRSGALIIRRRIVFTSFTTLCLS